MGYICAAFDQSLNKTGFALFDEDKLIDYTCFEVDPTLPLPARLDDFLQNVQSLCLETSVSNIDWLFFEDIQMQAGNVKTYQRLAYVQAMLMWWAWTNSINYKILAPSHWRKVLGGKWGRKRAEQKQHAIELVKEKYGIEADSDTADAICIGMAGIQEMKEELEGF